MLQNLGYRPNKIFALSALERKDLLDNELDKEQPENAELTHLARHLSPHEIDRELRSRLKEIGLQNFVCQFAVPLLKTLDRGWTDGTISIAREHLVSDRLEQLLKEQLAQSKTSTHKPRMLFVTLNNERHKLGLLLAASLFVSAGLDCFMINEELPLTEIPQLALDLNVAGVALSFSAHYPTRQAKKDLAQLRSNLDQGIRLIAGGQAVQGGVALKNLFICAELEDIPGLARKLFTLQETR
jgi:methylmalonyl-CoA mutase cobalamin-binding subunit